MIVPFAPLLLLVFQGVDAFNRHNKFCWPKNTARGNGIAPSVCPSGTEQSGAVCYPSCADGYEGAGSKCLKVCRAGYVGIEELCVNNVVSEFLKRAGYTSGQTLQDFLIKDAPGQDNLRRQRRSSLEKRETSEEVYVYSKSSYDRGVSQLTCGDAAEWDPATQLCYPTCQNGYRGLKNVCWGPCVKDTLYICGPGCATSKKMCEEALYNQTQGAVQFKINLAVSSASARVDLGWSTGVNMNNFDRLEKAGLDESLLASVKAMWRNTLSRSFTFKMLSDETREKLLNAGVGTLLDSANNGTPFNWKQYNADAIKEMATHFVHPDCNE